MDRFEAMQKQLFCKLNSIEEKFDGMVQALGFARSVVPEEANHFCGDLIIGGNSQQHMNQPSTGIPIYGRGGNNANWLVLEIRREYLSEYKRIFFG